MTTAAPINVLLTPTTGMPATTPVAGMPAMTPAATPLAARLPAGAGPAESFAATLLAMRRTTGGVAFSPLQPAALAAGETAGLAAGETTGLADAALALLLTPVAAGGDLPPDPTASPSGETARALPPIGSASPPTGNDLPPLVPLPNAPLPGEDIVVDAPASADESPAAGRDGSGRSPPLFTLQQAREQLVVARSTAPPTQSPTATGDGDPTAAAASGASGPIIPTASPAAVSRADPVVGRDARQALDMLRRLADTPTVMQHASSAPGSGPDTAPTGLLHAPAGGGMHFDSLLQVTQPSVNRPLQPLADPNAFAQGLADRLFVMSEDGTQSARLQLKPERLGKLDISIRIEDDTARVSFTAHHGHTREALEAALPRLRDLFAGQGMQLVQADVDTDHRHGGTAEPFDDTVLTGSDDEALSAQAPPSPVVLGYVGDRSLDIYV